MGRSQTAVGDVWYGEAARAVVGVRLEVDPEVASSCGERERRRRRLTSLVRRQRVRRRCIHQHTIRYDTRCYLNVRSKANMSQLNLPHETDN